MPAVKRKKKERETRAQIVSTNLLMKGDRAERGSQAFDGEPARFHCMSSDV